MADNIDADKIWKALGASKRYHILLILYADFICMLISVFPALVYVFVGYSPSHQCKPLSKDLYEYGYTDQYNVTYDILSYESCYTKLAFNSSNTTHVIDVPCNNGHRYDTEVDTFVTEWNLVCSKAGLGELTQTVWTAGQAVGALIFPILADRYGRKKIAVLTMLLMVAFGLVAAFANYYLYLVVRFLTGAFQQGTDLSMAILIMEQIPTENRGIVNSIGSLGWATHSIIVAGIGYLMRNMNWRYLQLVCALVGIHSLAAFWIFDESVRWLIVNDRIPDAQRVIKRVARINKVDVNKVLTLLEHEVIPLKENEESDNFTRQKESLQQENILTILTNRRLLKTFLVLAFTWLTNSLVYYGLILTSTQLAGDRYLNFFINIALEFPAVLSFMFLVKRFKRKQLSVFYHSIASISLILSVTLGTIKGNETSQILSVVFSFVGKFGISGSFAAIFLWTPELYPTNLRNIGFGLGSIVARIGGMLAPYSSMLATYLEWGPGIIFGILCVVTTLLQLLLPETSGKELPQTVKELQEWDIKKPTSYIKC